MAQKAPSQRRRTACKRCHSQKLRCPSPLAEGGPCGRCINIGADCIFAAKFQRCGPVSHPEWNGVQPTNWSTSSYFLADDSVSTQGNLLHDENLDFSSGMNFESMSNHALNDSTHLFRAEETTTNQSAVDFARIPSHTNVACESQGNQQGFNAESSGLGNITGHQSQLPSLQPLQNADPGGPGSLELHETFNKLDKIYLAIPTLATFEDDAVPQIQNQIDKAEETDGTESYSRVGRQPFFSLDDLFNLSQEVIIALKKAHHTGDGRFATSNSEDVVMNGIFPSSKPAVFDTASMFLLLACHQRCIDIWNLVFTHMNHMIDHGKFPSDENGGVKPCTEVKIGSYTPPSTGLAVSLLLSSIMSLLQEMNIYSGQLADSFATPLTIHAGVSSGRSTQQQVSDSTRSSMAVVEAIKANTSSTQNAKIRLKGIQKRLEDGHVPGCQSH